MSKIEVNAVEPQCGTTLTIGASDTSIAGIGTVNWDTTAKTAAFTAVSGRGYFCNTTSSAFTATLPSGAAGAIVSLADYAGTWQTNNLTVAPQSGEKIGGTSANVTLNTEGQSVTFLYVDSTQGWINVQDSTSNERANPFVVATGGTITTCGNCKIHTFTGPGTFTVSSAAVCASNNVVSYLVVAGGGGGSGGGGGAGGFREYKSPVTPYTASPLNGNPGGTAITVSAQAYPITVGSGGAASTGPGSANPANGQGSDGVNSVFSTITSAGGGGAGSAGPTGPLSDGRNGGSGGGAGRRNDPTPVVAGTGNTPPVSPAQGKNGGLGASGSWASGGGGGATAASANSSPGCAGSPGADNGGVGGAGAGTEINPSSCVGTPGPSSPLRYFAGGGGGQDYRNTPGTGASPTNGEGGIGGGGDANVSPCAGDAGPNNATAGGTNTGGGGGGGMYGDCAPADKKQKAGGSGIVIIRYKFQ